MARYEISNEVRPLDRLITGFASSCGYEIQTVFNDLLRFIIHGFSPGAPPISNWKYKRQPIQRQISCNNQNDKKSRVNTNIYSI